MSLALEFEAKANHSSNGRQCNEQSLSVNVARAAPTTNYRQQASGISEAEKQARYARGECFRCGDKFSPGHRCKTGTLRILEVEEDKDESPCKEADNTVVENPESIEISLHALVGGPHHATLIIPGHINASKVSVLIDCGSTHNFINDALLPKLGLVTHEVSSLGVRIGNGDIIHCHRVCKNVVIRLADLKIMQDLYPFALGGADIVLGVQWLASLNTVRANWKKMFLQFTLNGKDYELQGGHSDACISAFHPRHP